MQNIIQNNDVIYDLFQKWFAEACDKEISNPNAMFLATCDQLASPSVRTVLMKEFTKELHIHFFTNYNSRKANNIYHNQQVSLLFYWKSLDRQIRIEGICTKLSAQKSDDYFASRPFMSQVGAWASQQSQKLESMDMLAQEVDRIKAKYEDNSEVPRPPHIVPRPPHWGGFDIEPHYFEFWQDRNSRLHEREIYQWDSDEKAWQYYRLYP